MGSDIKLRQTTEQGSIKRYSLQLDVIKTEFPENEKEIYIYYEEGDGEEVKFLTPAKKGRKRRSSVTSLINVKNRISRLKILPEQREKCMKKLAMKGIMKTNNYFGSTIFDIFEKDNRKIPWIIETSVSIIEEKIIWMNSPGIYRVNGNLAQIQSLRFDLEKEKDDALHKIEHVHNMTGLIKLFFRELSTPLVPELIMDELLKIKVEFEDEKELASSIDAFKKALSLMNIPSRVTLIYFLHHLSRLGKLSDTNKMTTQSLALCIGPALASDSYKDVNARLNMDITKTLKLNRVFHFLIENIMQIDG